MPSRMKKGPINLLLLAAFSSPVAWFWWGTHTGRIHPALFKSQVPLAADKITAPVLGNGSVKMQPLPSSTALKPCIDGNTRNCIPGTPIETEHWAWNANAGLDYAVGGVQTTRDSIMARYGLNVTVKRQDDSGVMQADLLSTAQLLAGNPDAPGIKFITIMGDGGAQFFAAVQPKLLKVCADCGLKVIGITGYSNGEDVFLGPAEWARDPKKMTGGLVIGVLRDGDWNIGIQYMQQNGIVNNPDDQVYDPNAMNWIAADDYVKAANNFAAGMCVDLPIKGNLTGRKIHKCADGVVTWTPGDVTVAKKRGGVVPLLSTRENAFQMPSIVVGIDRWMKGHREETVKLLKGIMEGSDQLRSYPEALNRYGEIAKTIYREETPAYWVKYFRGATETDATGAPIRLGGSRVSNFADNLQAFGMNGGRSLFAITYTTFGNIDVQQYPRLVENFPPAASIVDTTYLAAIKQENSLPTDNGESMTFAHSSAPMKQIEGKRDYSIQFATGSNRILPASFPVLNQIADDVSITKYAVALHGHTDQTGTAEGNLVLSQSRADSVKAYLRQRGVINSLRTYAHGGDEPVAGNDTADGRAKNRRVQIVLGTVE